MALSGRASGPSQNTAPRLGVCGPETDELHRRNVQGASVEDGSNESGQNTSRGTHWFMCFHTLNNNKKRAENIFKLNACLVRVSSIIAA